MGSNDGVIETNDPDRPWIKCQKCGELEAQLDVMSRNGQRVYVLEAQVAALTEAAGAACDANKYYGDEMDALAALIQESGDES
jgi:hypothetical protein